MTAAKPSPERLALAYLRNWWNGARRDPRAAATDLVFLVFLGLMLLGLQFQIVSKLLLELGSNAQRVLDLLPYAVGVVALLIAPANAAHARRAVGGSWLESLPIQARTHAWWALRRACNVALLLAGAASVVLVDAALSAADARVGALTIVLTWCVPVVVVALRAAAHWKELLAPRESTERELAKPHANSARNFVLARYDDALTKGLASFALGRTRPTTLWLKLSAALVTTVTLITLAIAQVQGQLLLLGAVLVPLLLSTGLKPPIEQVFDLSRSLPLSFRRLTWTNTKVAVLPALAFGLPFMIAAPLLPQGGFWFSILLVTLAGIGALLFLQLAIEQAFPHSQTSRVLFMFAVGAGLGVFSLQAPLIAPFIGLLLCVAWLMERGWGIWEFGYGERAR